MRVVSSVINVYKKNNIKSGVVTQLLYGDNFNKIKKEGKWIKIKNNIDKIHDKLILQAKKLALVELQIKIKEQIEKLDDEINLVDSNEEDIPF